MIAEWVEVSKFRLDQIQDALSAGIAAFKEKYGKEPTHVMFHEKHDETLRNCGLNFAGRTPYPTRIQVGTSKGDKMTTETKRKSSQIAWADWEPNESGENGNLIVQFHERDCPKDCEGEHCERLYMYFNVPKEMYLKLAEAPSMGSFLHENIKDQFEYMEMPTMAEQWAAEADDEEE